MAIVTRAPGKLFIAGEYAVTTSGCPAIITNVPRYLTVTLTTSEKGVISSEKYGNELHWERHREQILFEQHYGFRLITSTMLITEQYIRDLGIATTNCYTLHIHSELDDATTGQKYGLGSSGAVTVAIIKAILYFYNQEPTPLLVYKLACLAHLSWQSNGSFADLATSAFDCCIFYQLFDKKWVLTKQKECSIMQLVQMDWPNLIIRPLAIPKGVSFLVGWTQSPASTEKLVADIKQFKKTVNYKRFLQLSQQYVNELAQAFEQENIAMIVLLIKQCRHLLKQLSSSIETDALRYLCQSAEQFGCSAKISGAGGGDCGICCLTTTKEKQNILQAWCSNGIVPLFTIGDLS